MAHPDSVAHPDTTEVGHKPTRKERSDWIERNLMSRAAKVFAADETFRENVRAVSEGHGDADQIAGHYRRSGAGKAAIAHMLREAAGANLPTRADARVNLITGEPYEVSETDLEIEIETRDRDCPGEPRRSRRLERRPARARRRATGQARPVPAWDTPPRPPGGSEVLVPRVRGDTQHV
jgi:hypothetical protein